MNYNILLVIVLVGSIVLPAIVNEFRHVFQVPEGNAVPLKKGKPGSPEHKPKDGAS